MKKCCVFTFCRNERIFLPIWLKYYSRFFDKDDIYVLDHGSDDGSIEECSKNYRFKVIKVPYEYYDEIGKTKTVCRKQAELLRSYQYVLYADADEIVVPDPRKYGDLKDYFVKFDEDYVYCTGYDLIHVREEEPPINLNRPILEQRGYWHPTVRYDKPLLSRRPLNWGIGFHALDDSLMKGRRDNDLWLLHLHRMDFDLCWDKHREIANLKWEPGLLKLDLATHLRINNLEDFTKFFRRNHCSNKKPLRKIVKKDLILLVYYYLKYSSQALYSLLNKSSIPSPRGWIEERFPLILKIPGRLLESKII